MAQQNFYLLLDLSVDPPVEDPKEIETAIKKKQAQWSRYRNHPTKGIQAKHFIDLIPEIRRVMFDPELRRKHAEAARVQREKEDEKKFSKIDRHLRIYLTKGSITNEEAYKLMQYHNLEVDGILKRAIKIENALKGSPESAPNVYKARYSAAIEDRFAEIENHLSIRMYKGFITEKEIETLAKIYSIEKESIKGHITYPIRETLPKEEFIPATIDKSIAKSIEDNLRIIGKSSLYEFLGAHANSDLGTLQKKAGEKRRMMLATTQKNAEVTAGGELAGHCITIFKSPESRTTYDVTRAVALLKPFESDIEMAQFNGVVGLEYYEAIVDNAARLGIEQQVIRAYVEGYCNRKNYKYKSRRKQKQLMIKAGVASAVVVVVFITLITIMLVGKSRRLNAEYASLNHKVAGKQVLEEKKEIFSEYLNTHKSNRFTAEVQQKIKGIEKEIQKRNEQDTRDYTAAVKDKDTLYAEKKYEALEAQFKQYVNKHPNGLHAIELKQKILEFPHLIDNRDFERLTEIPDSEYDGRLTAYESYLTVHPKGKHVDAVKELISGMRDDYFRYLKTQLGIYEKTKDWEKCIALCNNYFKFYKDDANALDLKGEQLFYQKQYDNTQTLNTLMAQAQKAGADVKKAMAVYENYLKENPKSPIRYEVKKQMALLKNKINQSE